MQGCHVRKISLRRRHAESTVTMTKGADRRRMQVADHDPIGPDVRGSLGQRLEAHRYLGLVREENGEIDVRFDQGDFAKPGRQAAVERDLRGIGRGIGRPHHFYLGADTARRSEETKDRGPSGSSSERTHGPLLTDDGAGSICHSGRMRLRPVLAAILCAGCANYHSSHVLVGPIRPPVDPSSVRIFLHPPANYEEIALVKADSRGSFRWSSQGTTDLALERLKNQAAQLGANGLLNLSLGELGAASPTLGTGMAYGWGGPPAGYGLGTSIGVPAPFKSATALAIRVRGH